MSSLSRKCENIYVQHGQYAVFDFIEKEHPKTPWAWCPPCECNSPRDTDYACLVCGSPTEPYVGQDGES